VSLSFIIVVKQNERRKQRHRFSLMQEYPGFANEDFHGWQTDRVGLPFLTHSTVMRDPIFFE
jgi:hypothetical protein